MNINIHPLLVHFPIGLLTMYALLELIRYRKLNNQTLFGIKAFLVITGFAAACVTWLSGRLIEHNKAVQSLAHPELIDIHSRLALLTVIVFGILAGAYIIIVLKRLNRPPTKWLVGLLGGLASVIVESWVAPVIAVIGLMLLLITGGLGGTIVYGPTLDPFTRILYQIFKNFGHPEVSVILG